MMKNLTRFFLFLLAAVCASTQAFAGGCPGGERDYLPPCCDSYTVPGAGGVCTAPSTHYLFTVNQFGFENQAGDITWFGTPAQFDANSSTVGQAVGNFVSQATLPTDTYVAFRANIVNNIQLSADTYTADARHCVGTVNVQFDGGNGQTCNASLRAPNGQDGCNQNGNQYIRDTGLGTFHYTQGSDFTINFAFYPESAALCTFGPSGDAALAEGALTVAITHD